MYTLYSYRGANHKRYYQKIRGRMSPVINLDSQDKKSPQKTAGHFYFFQNANERRSLRSPAPRSSRGPRGPRSPYELRRS